MRRTLLKFAALGPLSATSFTYAQANPALASKLLGRWRSDRELTVARWCVKPDLPAEQRERFAAMFGKLELHFTRSSVTSIFEGDITTQKYRLLASDQRSLILAYGGGHNLTLEQLVFEDSHFFKMAGNNIEYFRRIEA